MPRIKLFDTEIREWEFILPASLACLFAGVCYGLWYFAALSGPLLLHIAAMVTAWVGLLPAGAVIARWMKVVPGQHFPEELDNRTWWVWHQSLQYTGVALATLGFVVILPLTGGSFVSWHGVIGLLVMLLAWTQLVAGLLRGSKGGPTAPGANPQDPTTWRGDHFDMTRRRRIFEGVHKTGGWLAVALAVAAILTGAAYLGSPVWLLGLIALGWSIAIGCAVRLSVQRRHVQTYVAIWGPTLRSPLLSNADKTPD